MDARVQAVTSHRIQFTSQSTIGSNGVI
jgi:hypothetical protein